MEAFRVTFGRTRKGRHYFLLESGQRSIKMPAPDALLPQRAAIVKALLDQLDETVVALRRAVKTPGSAE